MHLLSLGILRHNRIHAVFLFCLLAILGQVGSGAESAASANGAEGKGQTDYWAVEAAVAREKLSLYKVIPTAKPDELTPANGCPTRETFLTWQRSHGDNGGTRYSALDQINRQNVTNLQVAWIYHSLDASNNLQCNPIIVKGVMFAPTPAQFVVAVNAENGTELWRFKPEGRPAFRGLIYSPGDAEASEQSAKTSTLPPGRRDAGRYRLARTRALGYAEIWAQ